MKNRRIVLSSLLLIAVLVMGIAFAALVDTLNITGTATFRPAAVVETDVDAAIYFTEDGITIGDYCVSATRKADPDEAGMTVVFNDAGETDRVFVSTATFTVVYQPTDSNAHLPAVKLEAVASAITPGTTEAAPGFTVTVDHEHVGEHAVEGMFSPGETMLVTVTVTCDATLVSSTTANSSANISVALNYSTVVADETAAE